MSFGCNIADQHHCMQIADEKLLSYLDKFKINYSDTLVLRLPSAEYKVYLSMLLGLQMHYNLVLIAEDVCNIVDDLDFAKSVKVAILPNASLNLEADLQDNADYEFYLHKKSNFNFCFNIQTSLKVDVKLDIDSGSCANIKGLYNLYGSDNAQISTSQNHLEPEATSNLLVKGVVQDMAAIDYKGKIFVAENAYGSSVSQKNKTLILSENAKVTSSPSMEVLNKNVQCAHGSAASYVDEEQLFYLQSRGLSKQAAVKLLINSFLD